MSTRFRRAEGAGLMGSDQISSTATLEVHTLTSRKIAKFD